MASTRYKVTINQINGSGDAAGFIDPKRVEHYPEFGTYAQHIDKERGNYRYKHMIQTVTMQANVYVEEVVVTGGSASSAPTTVELTLVSEHGDEALISGDLVGADALKQIIAESFTHNRDALLVDVFDSTKTTAPKFNDESEEGARRGEVVSEIKVAPLAATATEALPSITVEVL